MNIPFTHPGEILLEEFVKPLNITQAKLAQCLNVGIKTISEIYNKKRGITPVMAHKLSKLFGTTPEFWMNAQSAYELYIAYDKQRSEIEKIRKIA